MSAYEWLSSVGVILTILGSITGLAWYLRGQFARIDQRIDSIGKGLTTLASQMHAHVDLFAIVFASLQKSGCLSSEDIAGIVKTQGSILPQGIEDIVDRATRQGNPFSPEEGERLKRYIGMARRGELFTSEEAQDFYILGNRLAQEQPNETAVWPLLVLGSFLLGLFLGSKSKES